MEKLKRKQPTIDTIIKTHTQYIHLTIAWELVRCGSACWLLWRDKNNVIDDYDDYDDDKTIECEMC